MLKNNFIKYFLFFAIAVSGANAENYIYDGAGNHRAAYVDASGNLQVSASVTPAVDYTASGDISALNANLTSGTPTTNSTVTTASMNGVSTANIQVTGTFSLALSAQISVDGTNWTSLSSITKLSNNSTSLTITTTGSYQVSIPASVQFRITASSYTSGTATVSIRASTASSGSSSSGGGSGTQYTEGATTSPGTGNLSLCRYLSGGNTLTNSQLWTLACDSANNLLVNVAASALPTGASTSALQTTGNTALTTINTTLGSPMQSTGGTLKIIPSTSASAIVTSVSSSALEASHVISAAPANLIGCFGYSSKTSSQFIQLFNSTTVPADTAVPFIAPISVPAAPSGNWSIYFGDYGVPFATGIAISNSSTSSTKTIGSSDTLFTCVFK